MFVLVCMSSRAPAHQGGIRNLAQPQWLLPGLPDQGFSLSLGSSPVPNKATHSFPSCAIYTKVPNRASLGLSGLIY